LGQELDFPDYNFYEKLLYLLLKGFKRIHHIVSAIFSFRIYPTRKALKEIYYQLANY